jgi:hypothetical protein
MRLTSRRTHDGINRHDLGRHVPEAVKRAVRQRDGFGCVLCGDAWIHYDHVGLEFADADVHDPEKIVLLCGSHHDRKTRGGLSDETVRAAMSGPAAKKAGYSRYGMDVGLEHPFVIFGGSTMKRSPAPIIFCGKPLFRIAAASEPGAPFTVSSQLCNEDGSELIRIVDNEVQLHQGAWDIKAVGTTLTI